MRGRRRYALATGESIIGRDPGAAVFIDDASVSRRHARILVTADGATIEDLDSKNGTYVGEDQVKSSRALEDQDPIKVGSMTLTIRIYPLSDSTQTAVKRER